MKTFSLTLALVLAVAALAPLSSAGGCTEEAILCPDGSFVSKNPAHECKFDQCPGETPAPSPSPKSIRAVRDQ